MPDEVTGAPGAILVRGLGRQVDLDLIQAGCKAGVVIVAAGRADHDA